MVYAKNIEELYSSYNRTMEDSITNEFPRFKSYVETLFERKSEWSIC